MQDRTEGIQDKWKCHKRNTVRVIARNGLCAVHVEVDAELRFHRKGDTSELRRLHNKLPMVENLESPSDGNGTNRGSCEELAINYDHPLLKRLGGHSNERQPTEALT